MGLMQVVKDVCGGVQLGMEHTEFRKFLERDRNGACEEIALIVQRESPERLNQYEQWFLSHSIAVMGQAYRLRAMELYAFLKLQETIHYKSFGGFRGEAGPLAAWSASPNRPRSRAELLKESQASEQ